MPVIRIDCAQIRDWSSLHDAFTRELGFPAFYGRNMDAWIDCLTSLDAPLDGMTKVHCTPPDVLTIQLDRANQLPPEIYQAIHDCAAFVNWRRMEIGEPPVVAIAAWRTQRA